MCTTSASGTQHHFRVSVSPQVVPCGMCHVRSSVLWSLSLFASTQKPETLTHSTSSFSDSSEPLLNAQPSSDGKGVFRGIKDRLTDSPQLKHCNHGWAWSGHKMRPICRGGLAENSLRNSSPEGRNKHNDSCIRCLSTQYVHTTGSHTRQRVLPSQI